MSKYTERKSLIAQLTKALAIILPLCRKHHNVLLMSHKHLRPRLCKATLHSGQLLLRANLCRRRVWMPISLSLGFRRRPNRLFGPFSVDCFASLLVRGLYGMRTRIGVNTNGATPDAEGHTFVALRSEGYERKHAALDFILIARRRVEWSSR